jgi:hypothetical protein
MCKLLPLCLRIFDSVSKLGYYLGKLDHMIPLVMTANSAILFLGSLTEFKKEFLVRCVDVPSGSGHGVTVEEL